MTERRYFVSWTIDVYADSPREAAEEAQRIQRDPESIASIFTVEEDGSGVEHEIDLLDD